MGGSPIGPAAPRVLVVAADADEAAAVVAPLSGAGYQPRLFPPRGPGDEPVGGPVDLVVFGPSVSGASALRALAAVLPPGGERLPALLRVLPPGEPWPPVV